MNGMNDFHLVVGIAVGKILIGAFCTSPLFRRLTLTLAATALCFLYYHGGSGSILEAAVSIRSDLVHSPDFSRGFTLGITGALIAFGLFRWLGRR
jgi:hypothetical protein